MTRPGRVHFQVTDDERLDLDKATDEIPGVGTRAGFIRDAVLWVVILVTEPRGAIYRAPRWLQPYLEASIAAHLAQTFREQREPPGSE